MKRKATTILAAATLVTLSAPAWSQDIGVYVGGSIGQVEYRAACEGVTFPCDEKDTAWRVAAGYQFNRHLAVELGYANLGGPKSGGSLALTSTTVEATSDTEVTAWDLSAIGSVPLVDRLFAYGRAGIYRAEVEGSSSLSVSGVTTSSSSVNESNTGVILGIGLKYEFLRSLAVRAEWQRYFEIAGRDGSDVDVDVLSVGLLYRF
jgi:OmpA-OmpF porin, OOP family